MTLMKQTVTLEIVYDDAKTVDVDRWNWNDLLDMGPDEWVEVVDSTTPEELTTGQSSV